MIDFVVRESVAWVTLNRPEAFNALNPQGLKELSDVAGRCSSDPSVHAVVLTGAGDKAFCAGGDVSAMAESGDQVGGLLAEMAGVFHTAISHFARMDAPLIGAINGVVAGGGLALVACCDLVIASDTATFTSAYTQIGLSPDGGSTYFLSRLIGTRRTMELYLTNRTLSAKQALDWGLVNQVVPAAALQDGTAALAARLAKGPTRAYGGVKKLLMTALRDSLESQMEREARQIAALSTTPDGLEGIRAFVEKRPPVFSGAATIP